MEWQSPTARAEAPTRPAAHDRRRWLPHFVQAVSIVKLFCECDTEATREVLIARASSPGAVGGGGGPKTVGGVELRLRNDTKTLNDAGDVATSKADVTMPALADVEDEPPLGEKVHVFRGGRTREATVVRQLADRPCTPIHQSGAHRCA